MLDDIADQIRQMLAAFPSWSQKRQWLEGGLLPKILEQEQPIPTYSHRRQYQISDVTAGTMCSHSVVYFYDIFKPDPKAGTPGTCYIAMPYKEVDGKRKLDLFGGYINLDDKEQPVHAAQRELKEELVRPDGRPLLFPDVTRFKPCFQGIDYNMKYNFSVPTGEFGHSLELTRDEFKEVRKLNDLLAADPQAREQVKKITDGEVHGITVMPLAEALSLHPEDFSHPQMQQLIERFSQTEGLNGAKSYQR